MFELRVLQRGLATPVRAPNSTGNQAASSRRKQAAFPWTGGSARPRLPAICGYGRVRAQGIAIQLLQPGEVIYQRPVSSVDGFELRQVLLLLVEFARDRPTSDGASLILLWHMVYDAKLLSNSI